MKSISITLFQNKKTLLLFFFIIFSIGVWAQTSPADSLYVKRNSFYQNGKQVSFKQVVTMCKPYPETQERIKTIKRIRLLRYPHAIFTALSLGYGIGQLVNGQVNTNAIVLTGVGLTSYASIIFHDHLEKKQKQELAGLYNQHR